MSESNTPMHVGEVSIDGSQHIVTAMLREGCLFLNIDAVDKPQGCDGSVTLVTREGLLRLSQGPFEIGYIEDHL